MPDTDPKSTKYTGRCLCGSIRFEVKSELNDISACHCQQCRQWSGHFWASTDCPTELLTFTSSLTSLTWYKSSDHARRGFCATCGSSLFWKLNKDGEEGDYYAISAGSLDDTSQLKTKRHIFCRFKGDYYTLEDNIPREET
ncbi:GFA family protein [Kiloniella majae]|uniref:GFA family protein n=1 Tax=Kiloniella majae TaxID=1938558 RepID=UPI000A2791A9|nr:GFA family protein [Kiloniella majae]